MDLTHPHLVAEWHPAKNLPLTPNQVTAGSNKKVWWLCPKTCPEGCTHEWQTQVKSRTGNGSGCPYCCVTPQKFCVHTSAVSIPSIATLWNYERNGDLKPEQFSKGSANKVWWKCPNSCKFGCPHEWQLPICAIYLGSGCPFCYVTPQKICVHSSLAFLYPDIAKEWHPTKNGDLKPTETMVSSNKRIWWLCHKTCPGGCLHEWQTTPGKRTGNDKTGCPWCEQISPKVCIHTSIVTTHPEIAKLWHPTKNGELKPEHVKYGSGKKVWWLCTKPCEYGCRHEWQTSVAHVTGGKSCPFCSDPPRKMCYHKSIEFLYPDIATEWHPTKNGDLKPSEVSIGTAGNIWWLCHKTCQEGCLHEYSATLSNRINRGSCCPFCSIPIKKWCQHMSIAYTHPHLLKEWHPSKNGNLNPRDYVRGSEIKIWWLCSKTQLHEWETLINSRTKGTGCPFCINKTEAKLQEYLTPRFPSIQREVSLGTTRRFDFLIPELKLIIELDGRQHFEQVSNWQSPDNTMIIDIEKMRHAIDLGYRIIRIFQEDVYDNSTEWLDAMLMPLLLPSLQESQTVSFISSDKDLYFRHQVLFYLNILICS